MSSVLQACGGWGAAVAVAGPAHVRRRRTAHHVSRRRR
eukprot:CAMPEP_0198681680 /NCGR_PEP_ID=MMETSP1468-20131203/7297_1 /TAXON_ID=1461545 /ORGANISM="Mantoniella sp, Strain CCMP1436" /LENGTH=37 /DNA_ID= /DNA_START= /DNA_END= /DNA_ORIENTATION=